MDKCKPGINSESSLRSKGKLCKGEQVNTGRKLAGITSAGWCYRRAGRPKLRSMMPMSASLQLGARRKTYLRRLYRLQSGYVQDWILCSEGLLLRLLSSL